MELARSEGGSPSCQGCYYPLAENWVNSQSLFLMGFALLPALQGQPSPPGYVGKGEERLFLLSSLVSSLYKRLKREAKRGNPSTMCCSVLCGLPIPFNILTATVMALFGLSLSIPIASAITTWPKHPSPSGFPKVRLQGGTNRIVRGSWCGDTPSRHRNPSPGLWLTENVSIPTWDLEAAPARRHWPALAHHWRRGVWSGPGACWNSWKSWTPATPAWVEQMKCYCQLCLQGRQCPRWITEELWALFAHGQISGNS